MLNQREIFLEFVRRHAIDEPLTVRIPVLRELADLCGDEEEAKELLVLVSDLEMADKRCREFAFAFNKGKAGSNGGAAR